MDLNGDKESETVGQESDSSDKSVDTISSNVQSLKLFFQNQKQPIIGFKSQTTNPLDSTSVHQSIAQPNHSDEKNRNNRPIPRPPKQIQSCDIKVPPFLKSLVSNQCERSVPSVPSIPPVPMPRKSLLWKVRNSDNFEVNRNSSEMRLNFNYDHKKLLDNDIRPNSLIESVTKELNESATKLRTYSLHCPSNESNNNDNQTAIAKTETRSQSSDTFVSSNVCLETNLETKKSNSTKSRKPFKLFLRKSKLLRKIGSDNEKSISKKYASNSSVNVGQTKPTKPTRSPPAPPVLHFRPAAPLPQTEPNEDYYEDTLPVPTDNPSGGGYELYNDNDNLETEQIYCSLDNENDYDNDSDIYDRIDDYDDGRHDKSYDNYYEDSIDNLESEGIYEVLPFEKDFESDNESFASNGSTISLDDNQNKIQTISEETKNCSEKSEQKLGSFERKHNLKAIKLKKKFNLTGDEIPVSAGVVKEDHKGNRYDLLVRKGETVLILRMEGNPPGKYLAKNERSKVGFVHLNNISFDAESVKCIIKTLASAVPTQTKHSD